MYKKHIFTNKLDQDNKTFEERFYRKIMFENNNLLYSKGYYLAKGHKNMCK